MGLEDFERDLAKAKAEHEHEAKSRSKDSSHHRHSRHHGHRSARHDDKHGRHHSKRDRSRDRSHHHHASDDDRHRSKRLRSASPEPNAPNASEDEEEEWVEKEAMTAPVITEDITTDADVANTASGPAVRDSWMQAPSSINVEYLQKSRAREAAPSKFVSAEANHDKKMRSQEMNELQRNLEHIPDEDAQVQNEPAQHEVAYTFGDAGSSWRMTKLRGVYRKAKDDSRSIDDIALETYGDLRDFDDAREEERELDRRKRYGKDYVGNERPSGELFEERKLAAGLRHSRDSKQEEQSLAQRSGERLEQSSQPRQVEVLDQTALNRLKAQLMKAKLRRDPKVAALEAEYEQAIAVATDRSQSSVVVLSTMQNRMLAGGRGDEVKAITNKRGIERGLVEENEDMSIEDMVRAERRSRGTNQSNEGLLLASSIAKDAKFDNDLDYIDDNATRLAKRSAKSDIALRNAAVGDYQRIMKVLDTCPLCHHEDRNEPPSAPIVSLATRTYLTLPPEPELTRHGAVLVPIQHRMNLLECDDDEWEELRNFMKSLTRLYSSANRGVLFYEDAAEAHTRRRHAALVAVPLPLDRADAAPGFFKEALLAADEEWSQHVKIIDTAKLARDRYGKAAFRRSLVKEAPYFHVWFGLDGGLGHVVEDQQRWPRSGMFAREVIGGMLDKGPEIVKKQGKWIRRDHRVEGFRKVWDRFDWTKVLMDAQ